MSSTAGELYDLTKTAIESLGLTWSGEPVRVERRKLPKHDETVDAPLPLIAVVPSDRPGKDVPFDTGRSNPRRLRHYAARIVIIAAGNRDNTKTNLDVYLEWRAAIAARFGKTSPVEHDLLLRSRFVPEVVIDRKAFSANYDYSAQAVIYECVEEVEG